MLTFQDIIFSLQKYWSEQDCLVLQPHTYPMGAGTFHPATFIRAIGPEPWRAAYVQPCRRPTDGRHGENPNRLQHYYQFQVILKPAPKNGQSLYLKSLSALGLDIKNHDIRFVEDNWESPTLGASGLGWEVWLDGMEISQVTYFQEIASQSCLPTTLELTYGLERLAIFIQSQNNVFDLAYSISAGKTITYGDIFKQDEIEQCHYNFTHADCPSMHASFKSYQEKVEDLIQSNLPLPAYDLVIQSSHLFNILDARQYFSSTERIAYIKQIRDMAKLIAISYYKSRHAAGFPLLDITHPDIISILGKDLIQEIEAIRSTHRD